MIDRPQLLRALSDADITEWILVEHEIESATIDEATHAARRDRRRRWTVIVHDDVPNGRGSARIELDAVDDRAADVVLEAIQLARSAVGSAWTSRPPSAPAKVRVLDPAIGTLELALVARNIVAGVRRPPGAQVTLRLEVAREKTTVDTKQGFHATWSSSALQASAFVATSDRSLEIARDARRIGDLGLDLALAGAVTDLQLLASAAASPPGPCAIVLGADALLHGGAYGVWDIFASHADAVVERQGLTRYRLDTAISPGADLRAEPLSITSDGAIDFATRSAPVGDEGEAVRRFPLVEHGLAVGLGLTPREAALRHRDPNGGVRNLVVAPGTWNDMIPGVGRVVEIRRLRDLAIDRYSGEASLEIALAIEHGGGAPRALTGGTVRLDLVAALARALRSSTMLRRGPYHGPTAVVIDDAELV